MGEGIKGIKPAVIILILGIIAVTVSCGYIIISGGGEGPSGDAGPSEDGTETPGGEEGVPIESATSIDFKVDVENDAERMIIRYRARNLDTDAPDLRVDYLEGGMIEIFIYDGSEGTGWISMGIMGNISFPNMDNDFLSSQNTYISEFRNYKDYLAEGWTGGEWTYTIPGTETTIKFYDVWVNPTIPDSVFQPE